MRRTERPDVAIPTVLIRAVLLGLACFTLASTAAAQTAVRGVVKKSESDPLHDFNNSIRALVGRVSPSVVQVTVSGYGPVESTSGATGLVVGRQESVGSGVIVDPDGYIITNAHVVRGAHRVQVDIAAEINDESPDEILDDGRGRRVDARIVGLDCDIDLALLKVDVKGLRALPLGDYNKLRQGDLVLAMGSPEGLQDSVTMGVVSSAARQPDPDSPMVYVQSDAPINQGSSGGPLINIDGEVVGINTFILTQGGGNEGLGFAIPSSVVAFAYPQLRKYGHVHRGEVGISVQAITPGMAEGLKLAVKRGVIISDVVPEGPADEVGLKVQDIITSIDGRRADNLPTLETRLFMRAGGERIKLGVLRGSEKRSFDITLVERPHNVDQLASVADPIKSLVSKLGIVAVEIDPRIAPSLAGLRIPSGVIVVAKSANPTVEVSLSTGDVIHAINGATVATLESLRSSLDHLNADASVVLQIEREGKLMYITFRMDGDD
jgi:serine protease Do